MYNKGKARVLGFCLSLAPSVSVVVIPWQRWLWEERDPLKGEAGRVPRRPETNHKPVIASRQPIRMYLRLTLFRPHATEEGRGGSGVLASV